MKAPAAGAVIGAAGVVLDAPAELGEHQDRHLVRGVVLAQVLHEVAQRAGDLAQQPRVHRRLRGVGVVAAVLGVEDACAEAGGVYAGNVAQALGDGVVGVLHGGFVHRRRLLDDVGAGQHVETGLRQVIHHPAAIRAGSVHGLEALQTPPGAPSPRRCRPGGRRCRGRATDVTGTPEAAMARGRPRPKLTPVSTFSLSGVEFPQHLAEPAFEYQPVGARRCARCPCRGSASGWNPGSRCPARRPPRLPRTGP